MPILGTIASSKLSAAATAFESIATVTVGSGGAANAEFTSIPSTYTHLQIRMIGKTVDTSGTDYHNTRIRFNSDTGSNYTLHYMRGYPSLIDVGASAAASALWGGIANIPSSLSVYNDVFGAAIIDILDYKNTNKFKTMRTINGFDANGVLNNSFQAGNITFNSGVWRNTNAITSITLFADPTSNWKEYSTFSLYGIKSA